MLSYLRSSPIYSHIRKLKYRYNRKGLSNNKKLSIDDIRRILTVDLGIGDGQAILVHCGFGYLNADFTPVELIGLLKDIVGKQGTIMMPFYPPGLSSDWVKSGRVFDATTVRCSTGMLSQAFANDPEVIISCHPFKAVAVWGENSEELAKGHAKSEYPYDKHSPYYKIANIKGSLSIGLGVYNCATVHCGEDLYEKDKSYLYSACPKTSNPLKIGAYSPI